MKVLRDWVVRSLEERLVKGMVPSLVLSPVTTTSSALIGQSSGEM
jgi:hypothetical protein